METLDSLNPPQADPNAPPPAPGRLVTPSLLFMNQGTTYRLGSAFAGTANPSVVWQQMIDNAPAAMMYYRELEAKDDDIADAIDEVKLSVMKRGWTITPGDKSQQAQDAANFIRDQIKAIKGWRNVLYNLLDAPFYGYVVAEKVFDDTNGSASLLDIVDCPQELFCFAPYSYPQIGQLRLKGYAGSPDGTLVPENKFLVLTRRPRHGNRMGSPILREIYWASWFKRQLQRFWLRYAEKGPGTAVVKHPENATADEKNLALAAADALINEVALAIPETFDVMEELLKGTRSIDAAVYEKLYSMLEAKIYRRIVGSTLTSHGSDGGKGTQALGNVHADTKNERSVELALQLGDLINREMIAQLILWNFGPDCPVPMFAFDISDESDMGERITTVDTLQQMGLDIPAKWAYDFFGIPMPEGGEATLKRPAAPAPPINTPAGTPDRPQFSALQEQQIERDNAQLDKIFGELRSAAMEVTAARIASVAKGVERMQVGPSA